MPFRTRRSKKNVLEGNKKMPILSAIELLAESSPISSSPWRDGKFGGMRYADIQLGEDSFVPMLRIENSRIVFEPSVFNGTGEETRLGIVFALGNAEAEALEKFEAQCRQVLKLDTTNKTWNSCVRWMNGAPVLKAKINMEGSRKPCIITNMNGVRHELAPTPLCGRACAAAITLRTVYSQRNACGFVAEVISLRTGELKPPEDPLDA